MEKIHENMGAETALYYILAKAKKNGIYECIGRFATKVITLYTKRFGYKDYAESISEDEFTEQLIDCIEHVGSSDEDGKKIKFTKKEFCNEGATRINLYFSEYSAIFSLLKNKSASDREEWRANITLNRLPTFIIEQGIAILTSTGWFNTIESIFIVEIIISDLYFTVTSIFLDIVSIMS